MSTKVYITKDGDKTDGMEDRTFGAFMDEVQ